MDRRQANMFLWSMVSISYKNIALVTVTSASSLCYSVLDLFYLFLSRYKWKIDKDWLLRCSAYFRSRFFFGRQPTEYVNKAGGCSSCGVVSATWFWSEGRRFLRHKRFLHIVSLHPAVYKWVVSLDKARDTKAMQDRSSYEVWKNEM